MVNVLLPEGIAFGLNGDANYVSGADEIILTPNAKKQSGAAMTIARIDLRQDFDISFDVFVGASDAGADGLGFVLHNSPDGVNAIGALGSGMGFAGIQDGLAIEFDTWNSGGADIANDHTSFVDTDGAFGSTPFDLGNIEDGQWHSVQVSWTASTQTLSYTFDGQQAGVLNSNIAAEHLGGSDFAHFGFTAATGGAINEHKVQLTSVQASFESDPSVIPDEPDQPVVANGSGFSTELIASGLNQPISFVTAPDGRIFVTEKAGLIKVIENGAVVSTFLDINEEVQSGHDRGMMGIALDPNFEQNGYVYVQYAVELNPGNPDNGNTSAPAGGRLIRITADSNDPNVADLSSRVVIQDNHVMTHNTHSVGDVDFDNDGNLIFTWGDGGFDPNLRLQAQNPDSVQGKVFRIDPVTFEGVADNPFYDSNDPSGIASRVWAVGIRNSWKLTVDRETGDVYMGEVTDAGPEEVNVIRADGSTILNFGWPYYEDDNRTNYGTVPANFEYERAFIPLPHTGRGGGDAIVGGAVFRGDAYPDVYDGRYFFGNINQGILYTADSAGNFQQFGGNGQFAGAVDIQMGPDGHIWIMSLYTGELYRLVSDSGGSTNTDPAANASASQTAGGTPLTVTFDASASTDADGDSLLYEWDFESDGIVDATGAVTTYTFQSTGRSETTLTVSDGEGGTDTHTLEVDVLDTVHGDGNLALGRPTIQSGVDAGGMASRAVDGSTDGDFVDGSVIQTLQTRTPLWEVDLGSEHDIGEIQIFTRTDGGPGSSLENYWVLVSDNPFSSGNLDAARSDPGVWSFQNAGAAATLESITVNASGRYVRIQLASEDDVLSLAEVKVLEATGPINHSPIAINDTATTDVDASVAIDVLANDTDADGDALSVQSFTQAANGLVVENPNGTLSYAPNAGFSGNDIFTYTATDGTSAATASVSVTVAAPVDSTALVMGGDASYDSALNEYTLTAAARHQSGSVMSAGRIDLRQDFDISFDVFVGASDAGADGLGFVLHNSPDGVNAIGAGGSGMSFGGIQNGLAIEFDTYNNPTQQIISGGADIANDHTGFVDTDGAFGSTPFDLGNIEDGQYRSVQVSWDASTQTLSYTIDGQQAGVLNSDIAAEYLGGSDFAHFGFTASTGGAINEHKVQVTALSATFEDGAANSPPVAINDTATTDVDASVTIDVLANDTDLDGDALSVESFTQAANGVIVENPNGTLSYTPNAGFSGSDSFTYTATDGTSADSASVSVTVAAPVDPTSLVVGGGASYDSSLNEYTLTAAARHQSGSVMSAGRLDLRQDFDISFDVFVGASDAGADGLGFVLHNSPDGVNAIGAGGSGMSFGGIQDGLAIEFDTYNNPTQHIISGGADIANDHTGFVDTDGAFGSTPFDLGNIEDGQYHSVQVSWDASTQTLSYTFDGQQAGVLNSDIAAEYLGGSDFAHFGFTASTGGAINEHRVQVTALSATFEGGAANSPPVAINDTATTDFDTSVAIDVLANDTDLDGDALSVQSFTQAANGVIVENPNGTLSYTPNAGFSGSDSFTYTATDGIDEATPATVTITVSPLDDPFA